MDWLRIHRGDAPLIVAFPHGGTDLAGLDDQFVSPWRAQFDTDWWIADLYAFARDLGEAGGAAASDPNAPSAGWLDAFVPRR